MNRNYPKSSPSAPAGEVRAWALCFIAAYAARVAHLAKPTRASRRAGIK